MRRLFKRKKLDATYFIAIPCATGRPFAMVVKYNTERGFEKFEHPLPAMDLAGGGEVAAWSPDGKYVAFGHATTPWLTVYRFGESGLGSKVDSPGTLPGSTVNALAWSPDGTKLAVGCASSPRLLVYDWADGFGAKYTDAASIPPGSVACMQWHPDSQHIAVVHTNTPWFGAWIAAAGAITKIADPAAAPTVTNFMGGFSPDGNYAVNMGTTSPYIQGWHWTGSGFGDALNLVDVPTLSLSSGQAPVMWIPGTNKFYYFRSGQLRIYEITGDDIAVSEEYTELNSINESVRLPDKTLVSVNFGSNRTGGLFAIKFSAVSGSFLIKSGAAVSIGMGATGSPDLPALRPAKFFNS